jgi:(p)ppGpp synthase/HD superfamily hydrolase
MYHVSGVAASVVKYGPRVQTVAFLHDVLEDSDLVPEALRMRFTGCVVDAVELLTHDEYSPYGEYIEAMIGPTWAQRMAMVVKAADMKFNLNHAPSDRKRQMYIHWTQEINKWHKENGFLAPSHHLT